MDYKYYTQIPNLLRKYRKAQGLQQKEVARILHISSGVLSRWERGHKFPSLIRVLQLSVIYQTLVNGLFINHIREMERVLIKRKRRARKYLQAI